jgi:hypothetical protein
MAAKTAGVLPSALGTFFERAVRRAHEEVLIGESTLKQNYTKDAHGHFVKLQAPIDRITQATPGSAGHGEEGEGIAEIDNGIATDDVRDPQKAREIMLGCSVVIGLHLDGAAEAAVNAVYRLLSGVWCMLSVVCCLLSVVCCLLSTICCLLSPVYCLLSTVCCLLSALHCLLSTV